jgi:predicted transcriptional regulator
VDDTNLTIAAEIVAAYVSNNSVAATDLAGIIGEVHGVLKRLSSGEAAPASAPVQLVPAVPIKKSVTPDFIISLEDGKKFKSLKRHLMTSYGMTPDQYRSKWGLPDSYPIVAPNYAAQRSALAKTMGLGQGLKKNTAAASKTKRVKA